MTVARGNPEVTPAVMALCQVSCRLRVEAILDGLLKAIKGVEGGLALFDGQVRKRQGFRIFPSRFVAVLPFIFPEGLPQLPE
jgi:hypothetical protein